MDAPDRPNTALNRGREMCGRLCENLISNMSLPQNRIASIGYLAWCIVSVSLHLEVGKPAVSVTPFATEANTALAEGAIVVMRFGLGASEVCECKSKFPRLECHSCTRNNKPTVPATFASHSTRLRRTDNWSLSIDTV